MAGVHANIENGRYINGITEFFNKLEEFESVKVPLFKKFQEIKIILDHGTTTLGQYIMIQYQIINQ